MRANNDVFIMNLFLMLCITMNVLLIATYVNSLTYTARSTTNIPC